MTESRYLPKQGDIIKLSFDPSKGHEQRGWRPAVVVSKQILSHTSPFMWLVPISHGNYYHPLHVKLDKRTNTDGTIFTEQLKSFDYLERQPVFVESLPQDLLSQVLTNITQTI